MTPDLHIRSLTTLEQFEGCVQLQFEVWGYSTSDVIPRRVYLLASKIGGQVLGAYDGDRMIGFSMALPGYRNNMAYLHSHQLAVREPYRNTGIGRCLKLAQRDDALARGIELMEWTFDPLEIKNSYFNLHRLGAIARRYAVDFYGPSTSLLQGGLPTDRLYAEWWLRSPRVLERLTGSYPPVEAAMRIPVSSEVSHWKQDPDRRMLARDLQIHNRSVFEAAFAQGLAVVDYERDADGNGAFLLGSVPKLSTPHTALSQGRDADDQN